MCAGSLAITIVNPVLQEIFEEYAEKNAFSSTIRYSILKEMSVQNCAIEYKCDKHAYLSRIPEKPEDIMPLLLTLFEIYNDVEMYDREEYENFVEETERRKDEIDSSYESVKWKFVDANNLSRGRTYRYDG